jgi:hypothetical protein
MDYEVGLRSLKSGLHTSAHPDYHVYEARLLENLSMEQRYGTTEIIRAERARVIDFLNQLAHTHLGVSFNDLCRQQQVSGTALEDQSSNLTDTPNPFGIVGRIKDPAHLFGRHELLRQLFEELGKNCNRSLVGESQVGKSSILAAVCALGPEYLQLPREAFIYLDMQIIHDENDFYEALCDNLGVPTCRGFKLARALRGKRYILCLDEIEKMAKNRFTGDEREELRGLADGSDAPFKLVIASRISLDRLFPDSVGMTSPLANICPQLDVLPFPPVVARAFIVDRLKNTAVTFTKDEIDHIITQSGGYPAKLQEAAGTLFQHYKRLSSHLS